MITDFTIRNFRCFEQLTLPKLARVNLFVGKNGIGKTSVLEAVELWAGRLWPHVMWRVPSRRSDTLTHEDLRRVLPRLFHTPAPSEVQLRPARLEFTFKLHGTAYGHSVGESGTWTLISARKSTGTCRSLAAWSPSAQRHSPRRRH